MRNNSLISETHINLSLGPNPVLNITSIIDSTNVTLEWPRPEGRIETYVIRWWPMANPENIRIKNVSGRNDISDISFEESAMHTERVLIDELNSGEQYFFVLYTISYNLVSDISNLTTRTSECISLLTVRSRSSYCLIAY